jgi:hypothetical protein
MQRENIFMNHMQRISDFINHMLLDESALLTGITRERETERMMND